MLRDGLAGASFVVDCSGYGFFAVARQIWPAEIPISGAVALWVFGRAFFSSPGFDHISSAQRGTA
jgi:hypothetical protein